MIYVLPAFLLSPAAEDVLTQPLLQKGTRSACSKRSVRTNRSLAVNGHHSLWRASSSAYTAVISP